MASVLFAVNECYDPATKRRERDLKSLALLPNDFLKRYKRVFEGPFSEVGRRRVLEELASLVEDIFPSMAQTRAWYDDPDYAPMIRLRQTGSDLDFVLVEGL
jgi:hypothetical protein